MERRSSGAWGRSLRWGSSCGSGRRAAPGLSLPRRPSLHLQRLYAPHPAAQTPPSNQNLPQAPAAAAPAAKPAPKPAGTPQKRAKPQKDEEEEEEEDDEGDEDEDTPPPKKKRKAENGGAKKEKPAKRAKAAAAPKQQRVYSSHVQRLIKMVKKATIPIGPAVWAKVRRDGWRAWGWAGARRVQSSVVTGAHRQERAGLVLWLTDQVIQRGGQ
jgi:hypothetical protein